MPRTTDEMGVMPGSRLEALLSRLQRSDRRLFLAVVQGAKTKRRDRLQRRLQRRLQAKGIEA